MTGFVKSLKSTFGFIQNANAATQHFFHKDDFSGHWGDLQTDFNNNSFGRINVTFEEENSPRGPRAVNVRRQDFPNQ